MENKSSYFISDTGISVTVTCKFTFSYTINCKNQKLLTQKMDNSHQMNEWKTNGMFFFRDSMLQEMGTFMIKEGDLKLRDRW